MSDRVPRGRVSMQQSVHSGGYDLWKYSREKCVCVSDFFIKYSTYHRLVQHWLLKVLKPQCCAARKWRGPVHNGCMSGLGTYWTKIKQWHPTKERRRKKKAKKKIFYQGKHLLRKLRCPLTQPTASSHVHLHKGCIHI